MNFDIKLLVYFVAVADHLSFKQAAEQLNLAQPWLSRQIKKLETQLGFDLFVRSTRHVALTEEGERLLERARLVVEQVDATLALARTLAAGDASTLKIGIPLYGVFVEPRTALFDRFIQKYPNARLETEMGNVAKLLAAMLQGELDAIFAMENPGKTDGAEIEALTLCEGGIDIVMDRTDPLAAQEIVAADHIKGREMAVFSRIANADMFQLLFGAFDPDSVRFVDFSDFSFFRHLGERQLITALPAWQPLPMGGLLRRPFAGTDRVLRFQLLRHRAHQLPLLERFWRMARGLAADARHPAPMEKAAGP